MPELGGLVLRSPITPPRGNSQAHPRPDFQSFDVLTPSPRTQDPLAKSKVHGQSEGSMQARIEEYRRRIAEAEERCERAIEEKEEEQRRCRVWQSKYANLKTTNLALRRAKEGLQAYIDELEVNLDVA